MQTFPNLFVTETFFLKSKFHKMEEKFVEGLKYTVLLPLQRLRYAHFSTQNRAASAVSNFPYVGLHRKLSKAKHFY